MNLIRKVASVPLVGWLFGLVVLFGLLAWRLFREMRIAQQKLWVETRLRDTRIKYSRQRKKLDLEGGAREVEIHRKTAHKVAALIERKQEIAEKTRSLESTAEVVNKVFGDP